MAPEMAKPQKFIFKTAVLALGLLMLARPASAGDPNYRFVDDEKNVITLPTHLEIYSKEMPGPWKGHEEEHDPHAKFRIFKEGLESTRVVTIRIVHKQEEGPVKAVYVADKDGLVIGYAKFKKDAKSLEAEMKINSVINYIEIYVECGKHSLWKTAYRFV